MVKVIARITGIGAYLPHKVLANADLERLVDTSDEWIVTRTGIKERRIAESNEFTSTMGIEAAQKALQAADLNPSHIDAILVATMTPDYPSPATACIIQSALKATQAAALDIAAACTGFLYALSIAKGWVESGLYKNVLVIASEKNSSFINYQDRNTCVIFGDGAGAVVVSGKGSGYELGPICLGADGEQHHLIEVPAGGCKHPASTQTVTEKQHYLCMLGKEVFKHAVRRMEQAVIECLKRAHLKEKEIAWLIPHQANIRIMEAISKRFGIPEDRVYKTIHKYGNTSASSIVIALEELHQKNTVQEGENIILFAFGAGLTWGSALLTKKHSI